MGAGRFDYVLKELRHDLERITRSFYNLFRKTIDRPKTGKYSIEYIKGVKERQQDGSNSLRGGGWSVKGGEIVPLRACCFSESIKLWIRPTFTPKSPEKTLRAGPPN